MRNIASIANQVMPPAHHLDKTWKRDGNTSDIVQAILSAEKWNQDQTEQLAKHLKGENTRETLRNVWFFIRSQIRYKKDTPGHERVKLPAKTWADRSGDCKSMSVFIAGLLKNLGINAKYRFVSYTQGSPYTHVYVVAMPKGERQVIMDAVHPKFDTEEEYYSKKDYPIEMTRISVVHGLPLAAVAGSNDKPRVLAPWKPINWGKLTEGELRMALIGQQVEILKNWYGDPDGRYAASIDAINNALYAGVHRLGAINARPNALPQVVSLINQAKYLMQPAARVYTSTRDPRKEGLIPDYIGMDEPEFKQYVEDYLATGKCGEPLNQYSHPDYGKIQWGWNAAIIDIRNNANLNPTYREYLIRACREQSRLIQLYNEKLVPASPHVLYNFIKDKTVGGPYVATKAVLHQAGRDILGPRISGLSKTNMDLFLRNGVMQANASLSGGKLDPLSPEDLIKAIIATEQEGVGDFGATAAIVIAVLAAVAAAAEGIKSLFPPKDQVALDTIQGFGTESFNPAPSDWSDYMPQTTTGPDGKPILTNDPTKASTSWILPVLIGGGALLWGAKAFKTTR